ncbi:MAG: hypothetical protein IT181_23980 [Acidobacteria bacterium]|nr:hypothetical protein [Acidobacteriota bacterium]
MRPLLLPSFALLHIALLAAPAQADFTIVRGEVVDLACSVNKGAAGTGESHAACAMTCAKNGDPMALLTDDAVYVIEGSYAADKNAKLLDFVARKVEAKGSITERDGRKYINIAAMMVQKDQ